ncbi:MAG: PepSY-associated TM helix domain-containing protein, partial [Nitrospiraceae bacterium]
GDYGGLPLKMLWAVLDLITIVVMVSGLYLWWKKRALSVEQLLTETEPSDALITSRPVGTVTQ